MADASLFGHDDDCGDWSHNGLALIDRALERHPCSHVFGLFSGGHDSLCACHVAAQHPAFTSIVHIHTGIGVEATREFVRATCERCAWPLLELRAKEDCNQDYEDIVMQHGFPGPHGHRFHYIRLKERCLVKLTKAHKQHAKDHIMLVTGVRSSESTRRMGTVDPIQKDGARVWTAICHDWTNSDQHHYMQQHDLPRNPVKDKMCMSGECLCGAFAKKGELREWLFHFPDDPGIKKLLAIREKVLKQFPWDWDEAGPPAWFRQQQDGQQFLCDMTPEFEGKEMLCQSCHKRDEAGSET